MFNPNYQISNKILNSIAAIEAAREVIENSPLVPYWERQFREESIIRTVHYSTALEGNPLSLEDVHKVLTNNDNKIKTYQRDVQEILNYRNVVKYIEGILKTSNRINKEHLFKIHTLAVEKIVSDQELKTYRTRAWGTKNSSTGEISFVAPSSDEIAQLVDGFFTWVNAEEYQDVHPVLRSGITLAEIARIHPFTEGNGRTARGLATLSLYLDGYDIKRFFCLDEYYDQHSDEYYQAIQTYQKEEDSLIPWLTFFVEGLDIELSRVKARVLDMSKDYRLRKEIGQVALTDRQEEIIKFIEDHGQIRNQDWQELYPKTSDDTILRDLKDMMDKDLVKKVGKTKAARYELR